MTLLIFIISFGLLIAGAEMLVRGAARLAAAIGIPPLIIGLTVVAFGTSSPELAVGVRASLAGQADLSLGNVVGSNIVNILLILGISAVIAPLVVSQRLVRLDIPLMIGISLVMLVLGLDGSVSRLDGLVLLAGLIGYVVLAIRQSRGESREVEDEYAHEFGGRPPRRVRQLAGQAGLVVAGLGLLVLSSHWLVQGAVALAHALGLSELIIGLTVIAVGTALPEVVTSVVASLRGERDIAVGNVVGSNLFNILAVLGFSAAVAPNGVSVSPAALAFDIPVMIAVAVACLPIFFTDHLIARWEGWLFLAYYVIYTLYLLLDAAQHDALPLLSAVMVAFVMPITALTLVILVVRQIRAQRKLMPGQP